MMREKILEKLRTIEKTEHVRIILAVESGSRAWGFASPDSDYDVRFIYVREKEDYLRLEKVRDVLEYPIDDELDVNGWDLKKALQLLHGSNPSLFEWFSSPVSYLKTEEADRFRELMERYFSSRKSLHHYLHMAEGNYREYLKEEMVRAKKYFYVLRPILACRWILERKTAPPMLFEELMEAELPEELKGTVKGLLEVKRNVPEVQMVPRLDAVNAYIEKSLAELPEEVRKTAKEEDPGWEELNKFFLRVLERSTDGNNFSKSSKDAEKTE